MTERLKNFGLGLLVGSVLALTVQATAIVVWEVCCR